MRQLKHHEQKLLKKVNFLSWKNEHNQRELQVRLGCGRALQTPVAAAALSAVCGCPALLPDPPTPFLLLTPRT
jgi:hypothetical protein